MHKTYKGVYITPDKKAKIEWKLTWNEKHQGYCFSATGSGDGYGGQCLDALLKAYPKDEAIVEMHDVWKRWHLNNIRPGTAGHARAGCAYGKFMPLVFEELNPKQKQSLLDRYNKNVLFPHKTKVLQQVLKKVKSSAPIIFFEAIGLQSKMAFDSAPIIFFEAIGLQSKMAFDRNTAWRLQKNFVRLLEVWLKDVTNTPNRYALRREATLIRNDADRVWFWHNSQEIIEHIEATLVKDVEAFDTTPKFLKDSLGYPCPDTGELYGYAWFFEEIPKETLERIQSWEKRFVYPAEDAELSLGEIYVRDWCHMFGLQPKLAETKQTKDAPEWAKRAYTLTLSVDGVVRAQFPYYTGGCEISNPYGVVGGYLREWYFTEQECNNDFEEFCALCSYDPDSRKAYTQWLAQRENSREFRDAIPNAAWKVIDWNMITGQF